MPQCVAWGCHYRTDGKGLRGKEAGTSVHRFPKDPERRRLWTRAIGREDFQPTNTMILCSSHFEELCFDRFGQSTRLVKTAVPTLFDSPQHLRVKKQQTGNAPTARSERLPEDDLPSPSTRTSKAEVKDRTGQGQWTVLCDHAYGLNYTPGQRKRKLKPAIETIEPMEENMETEGEDTTGCPRVTEEEESSLTSRAETEAEDTTGCRSRKEQESVSASRAETEVENTAGCPSVKEEAESPSTSRAETEVEDPINCPSVKEEADSAWTSRAETEVEDTINCASVKEEADSAWTSRAETEVEDTINCASVKEEDESEWMSRAEAVTTAVGGGTTSDEADLLIEVKTEKDLDEDPSPLWSGTPSARHYPHDSDDAEDLPVRFGERAHGNETTDCGGGVKVEVDVAEDPSLTGSQAPQRSQALWGKQEQCETSQRLGTERLATERLLSEHLPTEQLPTERLGGDSAPAPTDPKSRKRRRRPTKLTHSRLDLERMNCASGSISPSSSPGDPLQAGGSAASVGNSVPLNYQAYFAEMVRSQDEVLAEVRRQRLELAGLRTQLWRLEDAMTTGGGGRGEGEGVRPQLPAGFTFPVQTIADLERLDSELADDAEMRRGLERHLYNLGGATFRDSLRLAGDALMSAKLRRLYNLTGGSKPWTSEKSSFDKLTNVQRVLFNSAHDRHAVDQQLFRSYIGEWLSHSHGWQRPGKNKKARSHPTQAGDAAH